MIEERWLPVVGFEGLYEVSDHGRVRSVDRVIRCLHAGRLTDRRRQGQLLKPGTVESGHQLVVLGRGKSRLVHALVLAAFVGPRPHGFDSLHGDGDPGHNHLGNLRWGTRSENVKDAIRHGTFSGAARGSHNNAKLPPAQIPAIRALIREGAPDKDLAARFGVTAGAIRCLRIGRTWASVPESEVA